MPVESLVMPDQIWPGRELLRGVATIATETHLFAWLGAVVASQVYIKKKKNNVNIIFRVKGVEVIPHGVGPVSLPATLFFRAPWAGCVVLRAPLLRQSCSL